MYTSKGESLPEQMLERIELLESSLLKQASLVHMQRMNETVKNLRDMQRLSLQTIEKRLDSLDDKDTILVAEVERHNRDGILNVIHPEAHWQAHVRIKPDTGSCGWLLKLDNFKEWEDKGSLLWLRGTMEAGKPILTHAVIEMCLSRNKSHDEKSAYVYCGTVSSGDDAFQLLAKQLLQTVNDETPPTLAIDYYNARLDDRWPSIETCTYWISELSKSFTRTNLMIDALDELPTDSRAVLVKAIGVWLSEDPTSRRAFISSHDYPDIEEALRHVTPLFYDVEVTKHNHHAIASFVIKRV